MEGFLVNLSGLGFLPPESGLSAEVGIELNFPQTLEGSVLAWSLAGHPGFVCALPTPPRTHLQMVSVPEIGPSGPLVSLAL